MRLISALLRGVWFFVLMKHLNLVNCISTNENFFHRGASIVLFCINVNVLKNDREWCYRLIFSSFNCGMFKKHHM